MRIALIAEKPSFADEVIAALLSLNPDIDRASFLTVFVNAYTHVGRLMDLPDNSPENPEFNFPRHVSWKDYPRVEEPRYRHVFEGDYFPAFIGLNESTSGIRSSRKGNRAEKLRSDARSLKDGDRIAEMLRSADRIYIAMDASPSAVLAAHRLVSDVWGEDDLPDMVYPWIVDLSSPAFEESIANARPWQEVRDGNIGPALVKRRFEYNYRLNAFALIGRAFDVAAGEDIPRDGRQPVASKVALQVLYYLRSLPVSEVVSDLELVCRMNTWRGSGRYPFCRNIFGGAASRAPILDHLLQSGLATRGTGKVKSFAITDFGVRFLDLLHPDCEDPDLAYRLDAWGRLPVDEAYPKVDRYIRTFFGKQKRFLARKLAERGGHVAA